MDQISKQLDVILNSMDSSIPFEEINLITNKHNSSSVFGNTDDEIIELVIQKCKIGKDDVFLDLGSGLGKPVFQIAMQTNLKKAIGIELSATRVQRANKALQLLREKGFNANVEFINDTFLKPELWEGATVVYTWGCCFLNLLGEIAKIAKKVKSVKYVALHDCSFEQIGINLDEYNLKRIFKFERGLTTKYGNSLYIYKKVNPNDNDEEPIKSSL